MLIVRYRELDDYVLEEKTDTMQSEDTVGLTDMVVITNLILLNLQILKAKLRACLNCKKQR